MDTLRTYTQLEMDHRLKCKPNPKVIKLLEKIEVNHHYFRSGNYFLPRAEET